MMLRSMFAIFGASLLLGACDQPAPQAAAPPTPAMKSSTYTVTFAMGAATLSTEAAATVQQAADAAKSNGARVGVTGYTDTVGQPNFNMQLSMKRAEAVKAGLVKAGVPAAAITTAARGETDLKVSTGDQVANQQNRRVEIGVSVAVAATMSDGDYCKLLAATYRRTRSNSATDGAVPQAMAFCDSEPARGIPTLVQALQEGKVAVPPRT